MTRIKSLDHVGITVADLDAAIGFFVGLGLELEGRTYVEGEFLEVVTAIPDSRTEIAMLRPPGGGTALELSTFVRPEHVAGQPEAMSTTLGIRNVCFEIEDLRGTVARLQEDGYALVGGIGNHEDIWLMAYVRGPEGLLVALAERIG